MWLQVNPGTRQPLYCTSAGRVLLADFEPDQLSAYFGDVPRPKLTELTVTDENALRGILSGVRAAGYAVIDQEVEIGLRAIAVPVRDKAGKVVAGVSVGTHTGRVSMVDMIEKILPPLKACANEIEVMFAQSAVSSTFENSSGRQQPQRLKAACCRTNSSQDDRSHGPYKHYILKCRCVDLRRSRMLPIWLRCRQYFRRLLVEIKRSASVQAHDSSWRLIGAHPAPPSVTEPELRILCGDPSSSDTAPFDEFQPHQSYQQRWQRLMLN